MAERRGRPTGPARVRHGWRTARTCRTPLRDGGCGWRVACATCRAPTRRGPPATSSRRTCRAWPRRARRAPSRPTRATRGCSSTRRARCGSTTSPASPPTGRSWPTPTAPSRTPVTCATAVTCTCRGRSGARGSVTCSSTRSPGRSCTAPCTSSRRSCSTPTGRRRASACVATRRCTSSTARPHSGAPTRSSRWRRGRAPHPATAGARRRCSRSSSATRRSPGGCASSPAAPRSRPARSCRGSTGRASSASCSVHRHG